MKAWTSEPMSTNCKITLKKTNLLNLNFCISELPCLICEFSSDFTALPTCTLNFIHHFQYLLSYILGQFDRAYRRPMDTIFCIHHFWVKQEYFLVARVLKLGREYFWNASKLVRCKMSWMITNRHQKKQSNISCIPDGNVHAFHHKIFYFALNQCLLNHV